ncbi:MAG: NAD-dependent epimerase/dehydratase family protein [Burkholderiales bacterium]|nr:NAD-dependent epimerase/dehydratase family protein [Burkholderiales bacterium]
MRVVVTGGGGFLGVRLARALLSRADVSRLVLFDTAFPSQLPQDPRLEAVRGDIADARALAAAVTPDTAAVFHLAAVVSGAAEADFDLGYRVNLEGMRLLLERLRGCAHPPRVVYTSSVAAFGGDLPPVLDDATTPHPQTSYGTQKVIGEYLLADYTRKGFVDGRALRLPTVVVRPGKPNAAASSFASAIIREPLAGIDYDCPVGPQTAVWLLSPRRVVEALVLAHDSPPEAWGVDRVVNLPGITATVAEMVGALARVAGDGVAARVRYAPDPRIQAIVRTWPARFRTPRALAMGFRADPDVETVIRDYIADEGIRLG